MPDPTAIVFSLEDLVWAARRHTDFSAIEGYQMAVEVNQSDDGNEWRDVPVEKVRVVFYREASDE